jgi:hypothetical protein
MVGENPMASVREQLLERRVEELGLVLDMASRYQDELLSPVSLGRYDFSKDLKLGGELGEIVAGIIPGEYSMPERKVAYHDNTPEVHTVPTKYQVEMGELLRKASESDPFTSVYHPELGLYLGSVNLTSSSNWDRNTPHSGESRSVDQEFYRMPDSDRYVVVEMEHQTIGISGFCGGVFDEDTCRGIEEIDAARVAQSVDLLKLTEVMDAYLAESDKERAHKSFAGFAKNYDHEMFVRSLSLKLSVRKNDESQNGEKKLKWL